MKTLITELRKKKKMTQEELATRVDATRQTIIALEQGRYNPSLFLAYRITVALGKKNVQDVFILKER